MKTWATLLVVLVLSSVVFAQVPPARACKQEVIVVVNGCILCGLTQGSGWCTCHLVTVCSDPPFYGGDVVVFQGNCYPPLYCNGAPAAEAKKIAERNRHLARNRWITKTDLPQKLAEYSSEMAQALTSVQGALMADDVDSCSWAAMHIVMRNKVEPTEPWVADLRDMGNAYTLTLSKHKTTLLPEDSTKAKVESEEIGTKWTLHLMKKGWGLESSVGDHANGSY